jgi:DNA polymerase delta subunit 1
MDLECSSDDDNDHAGEREEDETILMEEEEKICSDEEEESSGETLSMISALDERYLGNLRNIDLNCIEMDYEGPIQFILMDIDVVSDREHGTIVNLFGRTHPSNQSINIRLSGWYSYFLIEQPIGWDHEQHEESFIQALKQALLTSLETKYPRILKTLISLHCNSIVSVEEVSGTNIMGYHPQYKRDKGFLKIKVASPSFIQPLREFLEGDESLVIADTITTTKTPTFNSNLEPVLQFMVDKNISGCQWCQVPLNSSNFSTTKTTCDLEVLSCTVDQLHLIELSEKSDVGAVRILSFDLEAAGRKGIFPDPCIDPVIQIGIQFQIYGADQVVKAYTLFFV